LKIVKSKALLPRHTSFGWLVAALAARMESDLDKKLRDIGLNIGLWPTMFALWEEDGLTQTELTGRCHTAHYTTTRTLDTLEKQGLVERRPHPTSRRSHQVYLTASGKKLEAPATALAKSCNDQFLTTLTEKERSQLNKLILKLLPD